MIHIDADRCIHLNDHGQVRGRATGRRHLVAVVVTVAKGYDLD